MHKPLFRIAAGSVAAVGGLLVASAMPAGAATAARAETTAFTVNPTNGPGFSENTPVTFTVSSTGTLNVTVPSGPVDLGTGAVGTIIGPTSLGNVTVTDLRATNPSDWTATVSSTDFTSTPVLGGPTDTIVAADATYLIPSVVADTLLNGGVGSGLPLATGINNNASTGFTLSGTPQPVATETGADGDNAATWDPTIAIAVPALAVQGVYAGTITHSFT
jgi:hypothetical protein